MATDIDFILQRAEAASIARAFAAADALYAVEAKRPTARNAIRTALCAFKEHTNELNADGLKAALADNPAEDLRLAECLFAVKDDPDAAKLDLSGADEEQLRAHGQLVASIVQAIGPACLAKLNLAADLAFIGSMGAEGVRVGEQLGSLLSVSGKENVGGNAAGVGKGKGKGKGKKGKRKGKNPRAHVASAQHAPGDDEAPSPAKPQVDLRREQARHGALRALCTVIQVHGAAVVPYLLPHLPTIIQAACDKDARVRACAKECSTSLFGAMPASAFELGLRYVTPVFSMKWQCALLGLEIVDICAEKGPCQTERCLPLLIPHLSILVNDMERSVSEHARDTMSKVMELAENEDIKPFLPALKACLIDPTDLVECVHKLAGTTFVQVLTAPMLAIVCPVLLKGLQVREAATKRLCGVIVNNLIKLVEAPDEIVTFIRSLVDPIHKAYESTSIPEARDTLTEIRMKLEEVADRGTKLLSDGQSVLSIQLAELAALIRTAAKADHEQSTLGAGIILSHFCTGAVRQDKIARDLVFLGGGAAAASAAHAAITKYGKLVRVAAEEEEGGADELCNCTFTLAYGTKVLLRNVNMRLKKGHHYGLLGPNDCGKTTLLRSIANEQVDGFPPQSEVKAVFVESDIQGEQSHLTCIEYILEDPNIKALPQITRNTVRDTLVNVGFSLELLPSGGWVDAATSTLSGGWRMKLALARAMLQDADVLLMDEPTNHLDVLNVAWVTKYLQGLVGKTSIIVSHDAKFMDDVCGSILEITSALGLKNHTTDPGKGALTSFVDKNPHAKSFFELSASTQEFTFPKPGHIDGVSSKGKPLMSLSHCTFTYPGNDRPTVFDISVRVSLSSRVACVGQNGAGKSTMIKLLCAEHAPQVGEVYKHPAARVAYVAQHAFHHIEEHLTKSPVEYILWRYAGNMDKESIAKPTMELTEEEEKLQKTPFEYQWKDPDSGKTHKAKRVVRELTGGRVMDKKRGGYEYEVRWEGLTHSQNSFLSMTKLKKQGWSKAMRLTDDEIALAASQYHNPLTSTNVERVLGTFGLAPEFASHSRIAALSDGQKVKVVLAAAMWNQPHIVILDEPTNYLDRDSLGALSKAIENFEGGVVMITHNDEFCRHLCPERWVLEAGRLDCEGDAEWMANALKQMVEVEQVQTERKDEAGNIIKISQAKHLKGKELKRRIALIKKRLDDGEELDSEDEEIAYEYDIGA